MDRRNRLLAVESPEARLRLLWFDIIRESISNDPKPTTVAMAIQAIRERARVTPNQFAGQIFTSQATISRLEAGITKGSPTILTRIAQEAHRQGMTNTAEYLRTQAVILESEIRRKGGRR